MQELLRHSSIKVTMDIYTQAVTGTKRKAQSRVIEMIAPKKKAEAVAWGLTLHTVTWTDHARCM